MSCVYVLKVTTRERFGGQTIYKIGWSTGDDPHNKLREIFTGLVPIVESVDTVYYMICADSRDAMSLARCVHDVFVDTRIEGEYYDLPDHIISLLSDLICMRVTHNTVKSFRKNVCENMFVSIVTDVHGPTTNSSPAINKFTPDDIIAIRKLYLSSDPGVSIDIFVEQMYSRFGGSKIMIRTAALTTAYDSVIRQRGVGQG